MNRLLIFVILLPCKLVAQDKVLYEQIAFDYFSSIILDDLHMKKKLKAWPKIQERGLYWTPDCFNDEFHEIFNSVEEVILYFNSSERKEIYIDPKDNRFKILDRDSYAIPRLTIQESFSSDDNIHYVNISIAKKDGGLIYRIKLDKAGNIIDHCQDGWIY